MSTLFPGQALQPRQALQSDNMLYTLVMQPDGNAVVYNSQSWALWATNTGGLIVPGEFIMQDDGNVVLYDTSGQPHWASNTWGNPGAFLNVQDDGNMVVYRAGATPAPGNALWAAGSNDVQTILAAHNAYRAQVGVPPLRWSGGLAEHAQSWATHLAAAHELLHEPNVPYGQNIVISYPRVAGVQSLTQLIDLWGSEQQDFVEGILPDVSRTGNFGSVGHYTQMVWRNTTEVGCAIAGSGTDFVAFVCDYNPPGNHFGETAF